MSMDEMPDLVEAEEATVSSGDDLGKTGRYAP
jgi:hypothetical protein